MVKTAGRYLFNLASSTLTTVRRIEISSTAQRAEGTKHLGALQAIFEFPSQTFSNLDLKQKVLGYWLFVNFSKSADFSPRGLGQTDARSFHVIFLEQPKPYINFRDATHTNNISRGSFLHRSSTVPATLYSSPFCFHTLCLRPNVYLTILERSISCSFPSSSFFSFFSCFFFSSLSACVTRFK